MNDKAKFLTNAIRLTDVADAMETGVLRDRVLHRARGWIVLAGMQDANSPWRKYQPSR